MDLLINITLTEMDDLYIIHSQQRKTRKNVSYHENIIDQDLQTFNTR